MNNMLQTSKVFLRKNASTILTFVGGAGVVGTTIITLMRVIKWFLRTFFSFVYTIVGAVIIIRGIQSLNDFIDRTKMKRQNNKNKSDSKKK